MNLLFVTPYLPSPPRSGGQRRMHGLMQGLAHHHDVSVVSLVDPREDQADSIAATGAYCRRVVTVPNARYARNGAHKRMLQLASLVSRQSYERAVYKEQPFQAALEKLLVEDAFDVVQVEFAHMTAYRVASRRRPRLCLDEHNIEYDILRRTAGAEVGILRRGYSAVDWRKLRAEERRAWQSFDGCALTSRRDEELLHADAPCARTAVIPNGVDVDGFAPRDSQPTLAGTVLFFGALNYYPNTDGLLFFLRDVLPRLKQILPNTRVRIVGPNPPPSIATWKDSAVEVTGCVEDIRDEIARASVVIVPLRIGGGTRLKVLEAMAMGKAVVSTSLGVEGIGVKDERDVLLGDDAEEFAAQTARLLADPALARRLGAAARTLMVERYSWRASVELLTNFHAELLAAPDRS